MCQLDVGFCRVRQFCGGVAVCIHIRCCVANNFFFLAISHGNVSAVNGVLNSLFYGSSIENFLTFFTITINREILKGVVPSISRLVAAQNVLISSAFHLLTISVKLKDYSCRTDVIIILGVSPLHSYRNRFSVAIVRYLDVELACGPRVTVGAFSNVSIKIRDNLGLVDDSLATIELFHILECVSPKVELLTTVNSCRTHINSFPAIGFCIPLISGQFDIYRFRTRVIAVALIVPIYRNGLINQFNITRDNSTVFITCRFISAIKILSSIVVQIELSYLVIISNCCSIGDCLTLQILLIISPGIRPHVAVIGNRADSRVCAYNASTGIVTQKVLYSLAVSIQVQRYRTRTNAIIVAVIVPLDGKLHIIAGCNQTMI